MAKPRRLWDSDVIIAFLNGEPRAKACEEIIEHAEKGEVEIIVSMLTHVEVARLDGSVQDEDVIQEFFRRPYVISVNIDRRVAVEARRLLRTRLMKKPLDAVQAASAVVQKIPLLETYNVDDFKNVAGQGNPPLEVREPGWMGQSSLFPAP